jgi:prophage regulatory protein
MSDQLLRFPEVMELVKKSRGAIYVDMKRGDFPISISIGRRAVAWKRSDIEAWLSTRPQSVDLKVRVMTPTEEAINAIRARARKKGFKMNDIAYASGFDQAQLSRWSTGKTIPLYSNIMKLEQAVDALIAAKAPQ